MSATSGIRRSGAWLLGSLPGRRSNWIGAPGKRYRGLFNNWLSTSGRPTSESLTRQDDDDERIATIYIVVAASGQQSPLSRRSQVADAALWALSRRLGSSLLTRTLAGRQGAARTGSKGAAEKGFCGFNRHLRHEGDNHLDGGLPECTVPRPTGIQASAPHYRTQLLLGSKGPRTTHEGYYHVCGINQEVK
jgi:hypothetical protein